MTRHLCLLLAVCPLLSLSAFGQKHDQKSAKAIESLEMRIDPENLAPLVLDQRIRLMTRDGTYAEGRVMKASDAALTLRVRKSEPRDWLPRPEAAVPLSAISVVHMKKGGNVAAPITLGILGGIGGMVLGAFASCCDEDPGMILIPLGSAIGGAVGGSLLGREIVKKNITIYLNQRDAVGSPERRSRHSHESGNPEPF